MSKVNPNANSENYGEIVVNKEKATSDNFKARKQSIEHHKLEEHASDFAKQVKGIIFGGLDGVITTFSIMASGVGANLEYKYIVILGFSNLISDGFSMGFGDFVSGIMDRNYIMSEKEKETIEYHNSIEEEKEELVTLYRMKGLEKQDAETIVHTLASKPEYQDLFMTTMLKLELDLEDEEEFEEIAWNGLYMFTSFVLFGSIPVLSFLFAGMAGLEDDLMALFWISAAFSIVTLFLVGAYGAWICKMPILYSGVLTMCNGLCAAGIAYGIGYGIERLYDSSSSGSGGST